MFEIVKAAGWPIWPLLIASIIAVALIIERFITLRKNKIIPDGLLEKAVAAYQKQGITADLVAALAKDSPLGQVLAAGLRNHKSSRYVMKESIDAASSYVRSVAPEIGVKPPRFDHWDIHVHVPDGATPKDGPSAGLAMVTSIVSVLTQIPVRKDVAMTGEVSLRGNAMPIGGLKEKLLAALRGGIKTVFIPEENEKDLADIPDNVKEGLKIAQQSDAELHLLHIIDSKDVSEDLISKVPEGSTLRQELNEEATRRLGELVASLAVDRTRIQSHLSWGTPWQEIRRISKHQAADLIVVGTVGRSGIKGLLLGNTAERVLDTCDCSILTIKPDNFVSPIEPITNWSGAVM